MSLSLEQAEEIRRAYAGSRRLTHAVLAKRYGVSEQTIWSVLSHRSHVPPAVRTVLVPLEAKTAKRIEKAAKAAGVSLPEWVAAVAERAAR